MKKSLPKRARKMMPHTETALRAELATIHKVHKALAAHVLELQKQVREQAEEIRRLSQRESQSWVPPRHNSAELEQTQARLSSVERQLAEETRRRERLERDAQRRRREQALAARTR